MRNLTHRLRHIIATDLPPHLTKHIEEPGVDMPRELFRLIRVNLKDGEAWPRVSMDVRRCRNKFQFTGSNWVVAANLGMCWCTSRSCPPGWFSGDIGRLGLLCKAKSPEKCRLVDGESVESAYWTWEEAVLMSEAHYISA